ncbi:unnamed protein product, partial [Polarella glacialis]
VSALASQVERAVDHVGWTGRRLVIGGMSLGASVALRYAARRPELVAGLLLVAPSGMPEPLVSLARAGSAVAKALLGAKDLPPSAPLAPQVAAAAPASAPAAAKVAISSAPGQAANGEVVEWRPRPTPGLEALAKRWLARLNFIKRTPQYDVSEADFEAARSSQWPVTVVVGRYDVVHTPHVQAWRRKVPQARVLMTGATHWWICSCVDALGLEDDPLWDRARSGLALPEVVAVSRSRL